MTAQHNETHNIVLMYYPCLRLYLCVWILGSKTMLT